jgi:hypothetical protein
MSDDPDRLAWLYSEGRWRLSDGPIARGDRDDFLVTSGEVGYTETPEPSGMAAPFLVLGRRPARISMFVRDGGATGVPIRKEDPASSSRYVYGASLPDGLDVMARWASIAAVAAAQP